MKKLFLFTIIFNYVQHVFAQDTLAIKHNNYSTLVNAILRSQGTKQNVANRPNGQYYRVTAQSVTNSFANTVDSQVYKYSAYRTSRFDYESMDFLYNKNFYGFYEPIPTSHDYPAAMADSIYFQINDLVLHVNAAEYNNEGKIRVNTSINGGSTYDQQVNNYNSGGCIAITYYIYGDLSRRDTSYERKLTYSHQFSRIATDSFFYKNGNNFVTYGGIEYYYNNNTNALDSSFGVTITSTGLKFYDSKAYFSYDEEGRLKTSKNEIFSELGTNLTEIYTDSLSYSSGVFYPTFRANSRHFILPDITLNNYAKIIKYPGANGFPDSVVSFYKNDYNNVWIHSQTAVISYTDFLAPEMVTFYSYYGPSSITHKFYYEGQEKANRVYDIEVYPNPFNDRINIKYHGYNPSHYLITLIDISGRKIYAEETQLQPGNNYMNLSALATGVYILHVQNSIDKEIFWTGKMVKKLW